MVVKKADSSNRVCVDFRRMNNILKRDAEPISRRNVVARVANRYFSKLDLSKL